jgi:hypothetical protein
MVSSKGMRRVSLVGGALHVMADQGRVVLQIRTGQVASEVDAIGPAFKVGVELDRGQVFLLIRELLEAVRRMKVGE